LNPGLSSITMPFDPYRDHRFYPPRNFAALDPEHSDLATARVVVVPVPYDSTTTARAGAREAPQAIIDASADMELYDLVLEREPYLAGIATLPEVAPHSDSPEAMIDRVESVVGELVEMGKFVVTLGGEHTIAVAPVRAYARRVPDLSVLAFDAHADMREEYLDSRYNHACTLRRSLEAVRAGGNRGQGTGDRGQGTGGSEPTLVHVGLRSATREEHEFLRGAGIPFFPAHLYRRMPDGPRRVAEHLSQNVYITIDIDCFDPAQVAGVGTPEPGGLFWEDVVETIEEVARTRRIVGFDLTELSPDYGLRANAQLAAKLVYRTIGLALGE
jgi:agmatinase